MLLQALEYLQTFLCVHNDISSIKRLTGAAHFGKFRIRQEVKLKKELISLDPMNLMLCQAPFSSFYEIFLRLYTSEGQKAFMGQKNSKNGAKS